MRIIIVSDVHIGYELADVPAFENFIDSLLKEKLDELILLGDIFDFWRCSDIDLLVQYQPIVEKLLQLPLIYVHGNHDFSILRLSRRFPEQPSFKVQTSIIRRNQKSRFVLCHGYDLEVFTSMEVVGLEAYENFSEAMCHAGQIGGGIASWVWEFVELVKGKLNSDARAVLKNAVKMPAEIRPTLEKVDDFAKSPLRAIPLGLRSDDVLIFGHTHRHFIDTLAVNTGSWVMTRDKKGHTYVDITDDSHDLKQWPTSKEAEKVILRYKPPVAKRHRSKKTSNMLIRKR